MAHAPRHQISRLLQRCDGSPLRAAIAVARWTWWRLRSRNLLLCGRVEVEGLQRITGGFLLQAGARISGHAARGDITVLRIRGTLELQGPVIIGRGARIDIGPQARVVLGEGFLNDRARIVIAHGLSIGRGSAISWDVEILDEDLHRIGDGPSGAPITIGERVLICAGARILKGVSIADGCVVAAGAIVTRSCEEPDCLLAGIPARVVRRGVRWS